jgi:uncharacterized protein (DUF1330 family)
MVAYVIFDVDIRDPKRYQEFMSGVKPAIRNGRSQIFGARRSSQGLRGRLGASKDRLVGIPVS